MAPKRDSDSVGESDSDDAFIPFAARQVVPSLAPSETASMTPSSSNTPIVSPAQSFTPSTSSTQTSTSSATATPTRTSVPSGSGTPSMSPTASTSHSSMASITVSPSSSLSASPTVSISQTPTATPTRSPIPSTSNNAVATPSMSPSNPVALADRIQFPVFNGNRARDVRCLNNPRRYKVKDAAQNPRKYKDSNGNDKFVLYKYVLRTLDFSDRVIQFQIKVLGRRRIARVQSRMYPDPPQDVRIRNKNQLGDILMPNKVNTKFIFKNYTMETLEQPKRGICGATMTLGAFVKICDTRPRNKRLCVQHIKKIPIKIPCINPCRGNPEGRFLPILSGVRSCPACR